MPLDPEELDEIADGLAARAERKKNIIPIDVPYETVSEILPLGRHIRCKNTSDVEVRARVWLNRDGYRFVVVTFKPGEVREIHEIIAAGFRQIRNGVIVGGCAPQIAFEDDEKRGILKDNSLTPTAEQLSEERARSRASGGTPVKW